MRLRGGHPGDGRGGCRLADGCGAVCTRDPNFRGSGALESGHTAGFDFFQGTWCEAARERLPTQETREFWFPPEYNAKQWRTRRYHARQRGRTRAARKRRGVIRGPVA